jgi:ABC-type protease/lipase transport system fused ATPase/permease subunit
VVRRCVTWDRVLRIPPATKAQDIAAAQAANVDEFVSRMPGCYDTPIGERASRYVAGSDSGSALRGRSSP